MKARYRERVSIAMIYGVLTVYTVKREIFAHILFLPLSPLL